MRGRYKVVTPPSTAPAAPPSPRPGQPGPLPGGGPLTGAPPPPRGTRLGGRGHCGPGGAPAQPAPHGRHLPAPPQRLRRGGGRETPLPGLRRGGWARPAAGVPSPRPRPPAVPYPGRCSRRRPRCSSGASTWCAAAGPGASCRANGSPPPAPARRPSRGGSAQAHGNATRSATGAIHQAAYASAGLRPAGQRRVVRGGSGSPCSLLAKGRQSA